MMAGQVGIECKFLVDTWHDDLMVIQCQIHNQDLISELYCTLFHGVLCFFILAGGFLVCWHITISVAHMVGNTVVR